MVKRIGAWILILGFIFLIFNIMVLGWYREVSGYVYFFILVLYFLVFANSKNKINSDENHEKNGED